MNAVRTDESPEFYQPAAEEAFQAWLADCPIDLDGYVLAAIWREFNAKEIDA